MAAYAALVSVMQIIDQLQRHPSPPISINKQQVESLTEITTSLQEFLEGYNSSVSYKSKEDPLEMRIAAAAYAAKDVIESYIVDAIWLRRSTSTHHLSWRSFFNWFRDRGHNRETVVISASEEARSDKEIRHWNNFYLDLQKVIEDMDLIKKRVMKIMKEESPTALLAHQPQRNMLFAEKNNNSMMVGFDNVLLQLMGGIGKTTLARNIFQNALIKEYFHICAWVTISQQYSTYEIISQILSQVNGKKSEKRDKSEEELGEELYKCLCGRRYLVIMDNIWSIDVWENMKFILGDSNNGSRIIVTTRQSYLTSQLTDSFGLDMEFLDEVNSWNLFSKTVFGDERFPFQLEKIGKKIVKICRGLPLSIVVIGGLLAQSQPTQEYWEQIEQKLNSIVNSENGEYCLKILKMSYNYLSAYLKPSFLYMGGFEEDTRIRVSMLIKLWVSEGFLKPEIGKSLETIGEGFLKDLIDRNLILVDELGSTGKIRFCKMHDLLRDLCLKIAEKERFYHVIGHHNPQGIHNSRRVFYHRRSSNDDALKSMSHVRSFTSQYYEVGVSPNFRLLRILNAYDKHRQNFPDYRLKDVIHEFVNSRYLSIITTRWKTELPASLNFLWNLQTLRIDNASGKRLTTTIEIWKMSQLRHVEFLWVNMYLPDPPGGDIDRVILESLETLKGVWNFKFGEEVVKRIPNIKRLEIIYYDEGGIGRHDGDYYCISNLECLCKLKSFTCKIYDAGIDIFLHNITFPNSLRKLSLELYCGSLEETLEKIGSLPLLQKLKLRCRCCFRNRKWETVEGRFPSLKSLTLEYSDLEEWIVEESSHFPCLERLSIIGLDELEEIHAAIGEIPTLESIELVDCGESVVKSAKMIVEEQEELQGEPLPFHVRVFIIDKNQEALKSLANPNFKVVLRV